MLGFIFNDGTSKLGGSSPSSCAVITRNAATQTLKVVTIGGKETRVLTYGDILPFHRELPKNFFFPIGIHNTVANCASERLEAFLGATSTT